MVLKTIKVTVFPAIFLILACLLTACDNKPRETPEVRLKHWLTQMELAVKEQNTSDIKALISADYSDAQGNTRQKLLLQLTLWFKRYDDIGLKNRIAEIKIMGETARMVIDTTFSDSQLLAQMGLSQSTYQFVLLFEVDDEDWLLSSMSYQRKK